MKTLYTLLILVLATLVATFAFAAGGDGERHVKRQVKIQVDGAEEPIVIDAADMEVGDTRQFFSESGKEVLLTRTDEGFDIEIDGEKIDVMSFGGHHGYEMGGGAKKVFIHKSSEGGAEDEHVFVHHGEGDFQWVSDDDVEVKVLHRGHGSALEHLRAKGILDELDDETRQKIVEALEELEGGDVRMKKVIVKIDEEIHEDIHEDGDE